MWSTSSMVKGHHFFNVCPRIPIGPWFENFNLHRKLKVHIIRLRLGHTTTPAYLHRIVRRDNPYCSCDSISIGDINHVLLGCETHRNKIDRLYLNIKGKNDFPLKIRYSIGIPMRRRPNCRLHY